MPTIQVSEAVKAIIDVSVAKGCAENEADFVERAVRLYAQEYDGDDTDELIAEAEAGIADIQAGRYVTIASPADADAFWSGMQREVDARVATLRTETTEHNRTLEGAVAGPGA